MVYGKWVGIGLVVCGYAVGSAGSFNQKKEESEVKKFLDFVQSSLPEYSPWQKALGIMDVCYSAPNASKITPLELVVTALDAEGLRDFIQQAAYTLAAKKSAANIKPLLVNKLVCKKLKSGVNHQQIFSCPLPRLVHLVGYDSMQDIIKRPVFN